NTHIEQKERGIYSAPRARHHAGGLKSALRWECPYVQLDNPGQFHCLTCLRPCPRFALLVYESLDLRPHFTEGHRCARTEARIQGEGPREAAVRGGTRAAGERRDRPGRALGDESDENGDRRRPPAPRRGPRRRGH